MSSRDFFQIYKGKLEWSLQLFYMFNFVFFFISFIIYATFIAWSDLIEVIQKNYKLMKWILDKKITKYIVWDKIHHSKNLI